MLLTGKEIKLLIDLMFSSPTDCNENDHSLVEYVKELKQHTQLVHDLARNKRQILVIV